MSTETRYPDDELVELGDIVEVHDGEFEPDDAEIIAIGRRGLRVRVRWLNEHVKPATEWTALAGCVLVRRQG